MTTINKVLATQEDIAIGVGQTTQQRGTDTVSVQQVELDWIFRSVDEIRGLDITKYTRCQLHTNGPTDHYWYDATSAEPDNGTTVLQPTTLPALGRWVYVATDASGAIPLAGTSPNQPVTGPIEFLTTGADGSVTMSYTPNLVGDSDVFSISANGNDAGVFITSKTATGVPQTFVFGPEGNFLLPSISESNTEQWAIGAATVLGQDNVLLFASQNAVGQQTSHAIAFSVAAGYTSVMHTNGTLTLPRQIQVTDTDLTAVTKGYVDGLIPVGGGEANTASNQGAGAGLAMTKAGADLPFKTLIGGTNVTLVEGSDTVTVNASTGGGEAGDYIPLSGTEAGAPVTGIVEFESGTSNLRMMDATGISFGNTVIGAPRYDLLWNSTFGALTFIANTNVVSGMSFGVFDGTTSRTIQVRNTGRMELGRSDIDTASDNSVLTLGWFKTDILNADSVNFGGEVTADEFSTLGNVTAQGSVTAEIGQVYVETPQDNNLAPRAVPRRDWVDARFVHKANSVEETITGVKTFSEHLLAQDGISATGDIDTYNNMNALGSVNAQNFFQTGPQSADTDSSTKKEYVDALNDQNVKLEGTQTITGLKTFSTDVAVQGAVQAYTIDSVVGNLTTASQCIIGASTPSAANMATRKSYVDAAVSDSRLKKHIRPVTEGLNAVMALNPVQFEYDVDNETISVPRPYQKDRLGFIAQEVESIVPAAVHKLSSDTDDDGNSISGENYLGMDPTDLVPILVNAIQELKAEIDELKNA